MLRETISPWKGKGVQMRSLFKFKNMGNPKTWIPSESWLQMIKDKDVQRIMEKEGVNREEADAIFEARRAKEAQQILEERRARRKIKKKTPKRTLLDELKKTNL
jgi:hypothetical protein